MITTATDDQYMTPEQAAESERAAADRIARDDRRAAAIAEIHRVVREERR